MSRGYKLALVFLLLCFFASGCNPQMSRECKEFFALQRDQRGKALAGYPLEKQLRLYRCGLDRRPPDSYLADYIADGGQKAIPALLEELENERDELSQYGIIEIFEVMSVKGYLRDRPDVVGRIRKVVAGMKIPTFRQMPQEDLEKIEKNGLS